MGEPRKVKADQLCRCGGKLYFLNRPSDNGSKLAKCDRCGKNTTVTSVDGK